MTADSQAPQAELGRARSRKEDARLVTGQANWTDNIVLPGMLYMAFARSPYAHARITSMDTSAAYGMPGVIAVFSGADFANEQGSLPCAWPVTPDIVIPDHPPMATGEVRYAGEAVAVVVARDRYAAADAVEAIEVGYEPLPPVLDIRMALDEGSPKVHEAGNKSFEWTFANGDIDAAFQDATVIVERTFGQQRLIPSPMEPRAVVVAAAGGAYTVWSATQIPHVLRLMLALVTGIPEQNIRVIAPDVGGSFDSKLQVTAEEVLALLVARRLGRPVKWTESRSEGSRTVHHGRGQWQRLRLAADRDGRLRGLSVDLLADMGAYLMLTTPGVPLLGAFIYNAIYKMDAYSFRCTGVFTTKTPTDAYRGAGRAEATFAIERMMDELAAELGMDPLEVRQRNWIAHEEFPYTTISGLTYDSGNYEAATARAKELFGYHELRAEQELRRDTDDPVQLGIGVSTYTEMCGLAPSRVLGTLSYGTGDWESASVRMLPTGKVEVVTGSSVPEQDYETIFGQIAADRLGVPFEDVRVLHGDTLAMSAGMDTYGSDALTVGGMALNAACGKVIEKARRIAAHLLEAPPEEVEFSAGVFSTHGGAVRTIQEVALATFAAHDLPEGVEPTLDSDATYGPDSFSFPHGTHLCAAKVDTETGRVTICSYVAVDDVGKVVNPLLVDGQVHGGLAQGIAQALYEEALYDDQGNLVTTTLADYLLPSAVDLPDFTTDRTETPATTNPLGVKGPVEIGAIGSTPAVVNAVLDALRPLGVRDVPMPCTPERVWRAIRDAEPELPQVHGRLPQAREGPPRRVVSSGFALAHGGSQTVGPDSTLQAGQPYVYWFEISGESAPDAIDMPRHRSVPLEQAASGTPLTVVLFGFPGEIEIEADGDVGEFVITADGTAQVTRSPLPEQPHSPRRARLLFPVRMPEESGRYRLRSNLYCRQTLLQSRLIEVEVTSRPQPSRQALRSTVDFTVNSTLNPELLAAIQPLRLSVLLNDTGDGTHGFRFFGEHNLKGNAVIDGQQLQNLLDLARRAYHLAAWDSEDEWQPEWNRKLERYVYLSAPGPQRLAGDLIRMARAGYRLWARLAVQLSSSVRGQLPAGTAPQQSLREIMRHGPGFVEVATKFSARMVIPASILYDYPLDTQKDLQVCTDALDALAGNGDLASHQCFIGGCASYEDDAVVCPGGFWGYRHSIGLPQSCGEHADGEVGTPRSDSWPEIRHADKPEFIIGVADDLKGDHVSRVLALGDARSRISDRRDALLAELRAADFGAHVVYFFCHGALINGLPAIQVGPRDSEGITQDNIEDGSMYWARTHPLVVLNGCSTAALEPKYALNLVDAFVRGAFASGVIGTEITVFESLATLFADEFFTRFLEHDDPVGEAVRRARLRVLASGNPLGLAYIVYAAPRLQLIPRQARFIP